MSKTSVLGINLTAESGKGQLDAYIKSAEWDLEGNLSRESWIHLVYSIAVFNATSNTLKYDCCPDLYPYVLFTMRIRRRSLYYFTNIVGRNDTRLIAAVIGKDADLPFLWSSSTLLFD